MGREIQRVPENWEHPTYKQHYGEDERRTGYLPLYDEDYDDTAKQWLEDVILWMYGNHPSQEKYEHAKKYKYYWEYDGNPPNPENYRSKQFDTQFKEEPTWYQIYETVSEGTPVSSKFETLGEMKEWLIKEGYTEGAAQAFTESGWVPSMVVTGGRIYSDIESAGIV